MSDLSHQPSPLEGSGNSVFPTTTGSQSDGKSEVVTSTVPTLLRSSFASTPPLNTAHVSLVKDWKISKEPGDARNGTKARGEKMEQLQIEAKDGTDIELRVHMSVNVETGSSIIRGHFKTLFEKRTGSATYDPHFYMCFMSGTCDGLPETGLVIQYPGTGKRTTDDEGSHLQHPPVGTNDPWLSAQNRAMWWVNSKSNDELCTLLLGKVLGDAEATFFRNQALLMIEGIYKKGYEMQAISFNTADTPEIPPVSIGGFMTSIFSRFW